MKIVSEGEKAKMLLSLTRCDVSSASYNFLVNTVRNLAASGKLDTMSEKQQKWFDDLYDKHFDTVGGNDGS